MLLMSVRQHSTDLLGVASYTRRVNLTHSFIASDGGVKLPRLTVRNRSLQRLNEQGVDL
jgi:hypothetical protein